MSKLIELRKNKLQQEIKEMKKERVLYTFLGILQPSYPASPAGGLQLCGYLGMIISSILLATGNYMIEFSATLMILGASTIVTTIATAGSYINYYKKEYLERKIKELKKIDSNDNVLSQYNTKEIADVKSSKKNNVIQKSKSGMDRISELKEYKRKIVNYNQHQMQPQTNKQKIKVLKR